MKIVALDPKDSEHLGRRLTDCRELEDQLRVANDLFRKELSKLCKKYKLPKSGMIQLSDDGKYLVELQSIGSRDE